MDMEEIVKQTLEILRDTDGDTAIQVICDLDTNYVLNRIKAGGNDHENKRHID